MAVLEVEGLRVLPTDGLLNIVDSTSLAFAVVALSLVSTHKGGIQHLLFGDILGISWLDLVLIAMLLVGAAVYRLVSRHLGTYLVHSSVIGGGCAVLGPLGSGLTIGLRAPAW
jgi:ABC-type Mn2+/Zn2+ transport system permease subunit